MAFSSLSYPFKKWTVGAYKGDTCQLFPHTSFRVHPNCRCRAPCYGWLKMKFGANTNRCDKKPSAAFTMTEVVVGVAIFSIAFIAGYFGIVQGYNLMEDTRENERATQILQDKTEVLRLYTWDELTNIAFTPLTFTNFYNPAGQADGPTYYGTVTISNAPFAESYATDIEVLTFRLNWSNNNLNHQRRLTTLVSRYGMHNYVYGPTN